MAKTKSKKAPGRLSKVLRAFNPRSFRGGMALFALVFAFTGGGYLVYNTFAAAIIKALSGSQLSGRNGAYTVTETSSDKKNMTVWELPKQGSRVDGFFPISYIKQRKTYSLCATAKVIGGDVSTVDFAVLKRIGSGDSGLRSQSVTFDTTYRKKCFRYELGPSSDTFGYVIRISYVDPTNPRKIRVSNMSLEY